ncbi:hypothetical protein TD95_004728 [Thielaviopsis punctulata]|uniref:Uncharacterized protein n=1 Tax=Thielaviopsis punctulata TaxID=72032 RepID=A0A0F4ZD95_9PEZI|nr:hypothetical protein TD95_004728 [Thielaviopsis punctulata]
MAPGPPAFKQVALSASTTSNAMSGYSFAQAGSLHSQRPLLNQPRFPVAVGADWTGLSPASYQLQPLLRSGVVDQAPVGSGLVPSTDSAVGVANALDMSMLLGPQPSAKPFAPMMQQYGYGPPSPAIGAPFHASMLQPFSYLQAQPSVVTPQNLFYSQQYVQAHAQATPLQPLQYSSAENLGDFWNGNTALKVLV